MIRNDSSINLAHQASNRSSRDTKSAFCNQAVAPPGIFIGGGAVAQGVWCGNTKTKPTIDGTRRATVDGCSV